MTVREIIKRPGKTKSVVSLKVEEPSIKIEKFIAPKVMAVYGKSSYWTITLRMHGYNNLCLLCSSKSSIL